MILAVLLIIINVYILIELGKKPATAVISTEKWTVYGTNDCEWCRKQLEYMKNW